MRPAFFAVLTALACGRSPEIPVPDSSTTTCAACAPAYLASQGLTVHEWGTFTSVVASDGTLLPGLHHEEEDLPPFVADRVAQAKWPSNIYPNEKMETPVTYFYAPHAMQVSAKVHFPKGMLTQWFPYVKAMAPFIRYDNTDPWLSTSVSVSPDCPYDYADPFHDGLLDWGTFDLLEPNDSSQALASPVDDTTWAFARNTASNVLHVPSPDGQGDQLEKFLFYRGLGKFDLPLHANIGNAATFTNSDPSGEMGALFLMRVTATGAGFIEVGDLAAAKSVTAQLPEANLTPSDFVAKLKARLAERLTQSGLYADESKAMVDTWERSYFLTPGLRLLYLLPQANTDAIIPLEITPAPVELRRTLVIRVELLTPDDEATILDRVRGNDDDWFLGKGRFAEPYLTRGMQLLDGKGDPASTDSAAYAHALSLLEKIRATRRWAPQTAE